VADGKDKEYIMGKQAPQVPDYRGAAESTAQASKEATNQQNYANRPDQFSPFGSLTYGTEEVVDPATGQKVTKWTQNQALNEQSQAALDSQLAVTRGKSEMGAGMIDRTSRELGQQMDFDQFGELNRGAKAEAIDMTGLPEGVSSIEAKEYGSPTLDTNLDYSNAPEIGDNNQYRNQAEDALYNRSAKRLDTRFGQGKEALEVKLAGQGLAPGDQAYDAAMGNFTDSRNDAYSSAQNDAITMGGAEATRNFGMDTDRRKMATGETASQFNARNQALQSQQGMDLSSGGQQYAEAVGAGAFQNSARSQALAEQTAIKDRGYTNAQDAANNANALRTSAINEEQNRRQQSLNEMNAVLSGQQVNPAQMAPINLSSRAASADYSGAMRDRYDADTARTNASNQTMQGLMGGATGIGKLMMSDRRLKKNITQIGTWIKYPLYKFQYIWGDWAVGVMSDEINKDAVFKHASGFDIVNYDRVK
tara:strand:+ start:514 stop:1944 length:1431 start_codon:yes stop_codon:yes gene_type:complete